MSDGQLLILKIGLPNFYTKDLTQEIADEYFEGDLTELIFNELALASTDVQLSITTGSKSGSETHDVDGVILDAELVYREPQP